MIAARLAALSFAIAALALPLTGAAQLFRTYVASTGSDSNPCTLPAPCRLLPAALAAVADGGEVWMLDSANFNTGPVTIAKSVSIVAVPGAVGSIVGRLGDGVVIDSPTARVALRNLVVRYLDGVATTGIRMNDGLGLLVQDCEVSGFPIDGIRVETAATAPAVSILGTLVRQNGVKGIALNSPGSALVERTTALRNSTAISVRVARAGTLNGVVRESTFSNNTGRGMEVWRDLGSVTLLVRAIDSSANGNSGFETVAAVPGTGGVNQITISASSFHGNAAGGVVLGGGGAVYSDGTNVINLNQGGNLVGTFTPLNPQ